MLELLQFVFSSVWTFTGTVLLLTILLTAVLLICVTVSGFAPKAPAPPVAPAPRNPWSS